MPALLQNPLAREHAQEILRLENAELERLRGIYETARLELLGRLTELRGETFTAQQTRLALIQVETALRGMIARLNVDRDRRLDKQLEWSLRSTLQQIRHYEPSFRQAQGRIQTRALRKIAAQRGLLLHSYDTSLRTYGGQLVGEIQRRLAVHVVRKSPIRDAAIDIAGRLERHAFRGARWRAERIVRTELIDALTTSQVAGLEQATEVMPDLHYQWDATLDARTSDFCRRHNGAVQPPGKPFGEIRGRPIFKPPALPHCRTSLTPWRQEWADREAEEAKRTPPTVKPPTEAPPPTKAAASKKQAARAEDRRTAEIERQRRVREAEDGIRANDFETAIGFNADGSEFFRKRGERDYVPFTLDEARSFSGRVLTHNHPSGSSFSPQDIALAAEYGLAEIRAVGRTYDHSMRPPLKGGWSTKFWAEVVEPAFRRAHQEVEREFWRAIEAGKMSRERARDQHWHTVWRRVALRTGLRYSRRRVNP